MSSKAAFYNDQAQAEKTGGSYSDEPPVYTDGPSSSAVAAAARPTPPTANLLDLSKIDYTKYDIPNSDVSDDKITRSVKLRVESPQFLAKWVQEQASLPPRPVIHIVGTHHSHNGSKVVDFDLLVNMTNFILRPEGWNYVTYTAADSATSLESGAQGKGNQLGGLGSSLDMDSWVQSLAQTQAGKPKTFSIERKITNWDVEYLTVQIKHMLSTTNYQGLTSIQFPNLHSVVIVNPPQQGLFASLVPRQFSASAQTMFPSMYPKPHTAVVTSMWPYATLAPGDDNRVCAVLSEQKWWRTWEQVIRLCIMRKQHGWITEEDLMDVQMGAKPTLNPKPWGFP